MNPNNCSTCDHFKDPDEGHCYMFRDEPTEVCMQHTGRQKVATIIDYRRPSMLAVALAALLANAELTEPPKFHIRKTSPGTKCQCGLEFNGDGQCVVCDF